MSVISSAQAVIARDMETPRGHAGACLKRKKTAKKKPARSPSRAIKKNAKVSKSAKETSPARSERIVSNGDRFEDFVLQGTLYLYVSGAGLGVYTRKILRKGQIIARVESEKNRYFAVERAKDHEK